MQNPPNCCHPMADPGAELLLESATPSIDREKFAQLHQHQWQLNKVILWLWTLTSPMWTAKQGLLPAHGWERKVQVRKCSSFGGRVWLFPEADLGHWLSFTPFAESFPGLPAPGDCGFTISNKVSPTYWAWARPGVRSLEHKRKANQNISAEQPGVPNSKAQLLGLLPQSWNPR